MLHDPGACDLAVLGHVADQNDRHALLLGEADKLPRRRAHLGDGAGGGFELVAPQRLDGIDHDEIKGVGLQPVDHGAQARLGGQLDGGVGEAHALGAGADLLDRLLAGDVGDLRPMQRGLGADLQKKRRLSNARVARQQHGRAWHHAAAAHPVELRHAGDDPGGRRGLDVEGLKGQAGAAAGALGGGQRPRRTGRLLFFNQRIPRAAGRTLPRPFGVNAAAGLADIDRAVAGHWDVLKLQKTPVWGDSVLRFLSWAYFSSIDVIGLLVLSSTCATPLRPVVAVACIVTQAATFCCGG